MTHVNDAPFCTTSQVSAALTEAEKQLGEVKIKFALKSKLTIDELRRAFDKCNSLIPPSPAKNKNRSDTVNALQSDDDGTC